MGGIIGTKKILEVDFSSGSYIFIEKKLLADSSKKVGYKGWSTTRFNILDGL